MATTRRSSSTSTRARRNPSSTATVAARPSSLAHARTVPASRGPLGEFRGAVRDYPVTFVVATAVFGYLVGHFVARTLAPSTSTSIVF